MTARSVAAVSVAVPARRVRLSVPRWVPARWSWGLLIAAAVVAVTEVARRPPGLDPAVLMPMVVLVGAVLGGRVAAGLAAAVGLPYVAFYYILAPGAAAAGGLLEFVATAAACGLSAWVVLAVRASAKTTTDDAARLARRAETIASLGTRLSNSPTEALGETIVRAVGEALGAQMAVLTMLDPPSGRHYVRAALGGNRSTVGVEVAPGVGITGQAIRDRRLIVAGGPGPITAGALHRRLQGRKSAQSMAAVAGSQAGRVITSLTVGRSNGEAFSADDQQMLEQLVALVTLAVSGPLATREAEAGSPRDGLTGLYNHAYLEAALEQLIALRRRRAPEDRQPISMIVFDIDSFGLLNERHGRQIGDHILRAVATVLRQRFRASDIVARVGGDSFYVVLNGADADVAAEAAAQIRRQVHDLKLSNARGEPVVVSVSAGCALVKEGERPEHLFRAVEAALDTARWSGPAGVVSI